MSPEREEVAALLHGGGVGRGVAVLVDDGALGEFLVPHLVEVHLRVRHRRRCVVEDHPRLFASGEADSYRVRAEHPLAPTVGGRHLVPQHISRAADDGDHTPGGGYLRVLAEPPDVLRAQQSHNGNIVLLGLPDGDVGRELRRDVTERAVAVHERSVRRLAHDGRRGLGIKLAVENGLDVPIEMEHAVSINAAHVGRHEGVSHSRGVLGARPRRIEDSPDNVVKIAFRYGWHVDLLGGAFLPHTGRGRFQTCPYG